MAHRKNTFVAAHDAPDQVKSSWRIPLSEVEVVIMRKKRAFWERIGVGLLGTWQS